MTSAAKACVACNTPLPEGALFCLHCGTATPTDPGVPQRTSTTEVGEVARVRKALEGAYRIERVLGEGGMATVYLAEDSKHHRKVAVKVMRPELAATLGTERFLREVEISAQLSHPHILPVYDSGAADGVLYYVMPYVEGESLQEKLQREGQLPVDDALRIAREVAEALSYAHERHIIHRDIKPANIMMSRGHALVADFGIARAMGGDTSITSTGLAVGTPQYMSPEQATGSAGVDGRADVYAMGCVFYEMLAGEPPFTGPTPQSIIARSLTESVRSLSASRVGLPPALDVVVAKALARNPADRYQSATAMAEALGHVADAPVVSGAGALPKSAGSGFARHLTLRNAALGGVLALAMWALVATGLIMKGPREDSSGGLRLAVLPFVNRGTTDDAYFVDGIADQIRGKLTGLGRFQVIARTSSDQYRDSRKSPQEIGSELEVDYLLAATVGWAPAGTGKGRVQVSPELIDVRTGVATWQQSFDGDVSDVFQVQNSIATQVAGALGIAIGGKEQEHLAQRPTDNLAAYDLFLKAEALTSRDPAILRRAAGLYEQAIALDSAFALAWAGLSNALSGLYFNGVPDAAVGARAKLAAEHALSLEPQGGAGHASLARYYHVVAKDVDQAGKQAAQALLATPNDPTLLGTAAAIERALGHWDLALAHFQLARRLDPRSNRTARELQRTLVALRRYPEGIAAGNEALALSPADMFIVEWQMIAHLAQGDLPSARAVMQSVSSTLTQPEVVAYLATYYDLHWVMNEAEQQLLLRLPRSALYDDPATWGLVMMQTLWMRGDRARARAYADTARVALESQLKGVPDDPPLLALYGLALAHLGLKAEAVAAGEKSLALMPISREATVGAYNQHQLVRIYMLVGEPEKALDRLEPLLKVPYHLAPGWLRIDPTFAPLKGNPRFERLIRGS